MHDQNIAARVGPDHVGLGREVVEQLDQRRRRDIAQRNHGNPVARLRRLPGRATIEVAAADGFAGRNETIPGGVADEHDIVDAQRGLERVEHVGFRHRAARGETDGALHARIDGVSEPENIAEDDLGDSGDRSVFEIELKTFAAWRHRGQRLVARRTADLAFDHQRARRLGPRSAIIAPAKLTRSQVDLTDLVDQVGWPALVHAGQIAG